MKTCTRCHGDGKDPYHISICRDWRGTGKIPEKSITCNRCHGDGRDPFYVSICRDCGGTGKIILKI